MNIKRLDFVSTRSIENVLITWKIEQNLFTNLSQREEIERERHRQNTKRQNLSWNKEMKLVLFQHRWWIEHLYIANQTSKCNHPIIVWPENYESCEVTTITKPKFIGKKRFESEIKKPLRKWEQFQAGHEKLYNKWQLICGLSASLAPPLP